MTVKLSDFNNNELLFLKKIIEISKRNQIQADACLGEPDFRIVEVHDVDRFSFVWEFTNTQELRMIKDTIIVPLSDNERNDRVLLKNAYDILVLMADRITIKKSPVISRLCRFIYGGSSDATDLAHIGRKFFMNLLDSYDVVVRSWDIINGEFTCNHGMLNYNRIYRGEYAYGAEELFNLRIATE